ncbi:hypothetical protein GCM10014713_60260 [Streptomyces purpureus]|uniref:Uncharacterized protein n=1 Tax=Streptomyces purpureus TaxID=1951 RepID=A0A918HG80_9ACTN|nr:hypothetical protein [Streptomyces purpureus]GGT58663.1 hypothetical protein GCM10014713_60260 [Streptomyces purpureus]
MLLHEFRPGRLLAGATGLTVATLFAGDAAGAWNTPGYVVVPLLCGGLGLAALATWIAYSLRRRSARAASTENSDAPASTSGSQAMR